MARALKRLNTNMPVELVARVDEYADKLSVNRTSAINVLVSMALDSQDAVVTLSDMMKMVRDEQAKRVTGR